MEENILILEGLPDDFSNISTKLELYFKNKRRSGGEIAELRKHPTDDKKALLVYLEGEGENELCYFDVNYKIGNNLCNLCLQCVVVLMNVFASGNYSVTCMFI